MLVIEDIASVRHAREIHSDKNWGLVPTMGFPREGRMSLFEFQS